MNIPGPDRRSLGRAEFFSGAQVPGHCPQLQLLPPPLPPGAHKVPPNPREQRSPNDPAGGRAVLKGGFQKFPKKLHKGGVLGGGPGMY